MKLKMKISKQNKFRFEEKDKFVILLMKVYQA